MNLPDVLPSCHVFFESATSVAQEYSAPIVPLPRSVFWAAGYIAYNVTVTRPLTPSPR